MRVREAKVNQRKEGRFNLNKIVKHCEEVKYGFDSSRAHSKFIWIFRKPLTKYT